MKLLEVKDLKMRFGKLQVLDGISFSIDKGEVISIIGSSGDGKTTLLRCLNFLYIANEGEIYINGEKIFDAKVQTNDKEIAKNRLHFGLVFQSFNLFPQYSALENIELAPKLLKIDTEENIRNKSLKLLDSVGLLDKKDCYPRELSGGQKQRVAIARALVLNPDILCFDEPTSALDPELTGEVLKVIKELKNKENTMIIVTHEMEFAKSISDKVIFLNDGKIEEMGTPDEIFNHPKSENLKKLLKV